MLGGAAGVLGIDNLLRTVRANTEALNNKTYNPMLMLTGAYPPPVSTPTPVPTATPTVKPPSGKPRVVHAHSTAATSWNFSSGWYGDYVDQATVNNMTDEGLKNLTGKTTVAEAWQAILPGYTAGNSIVIKANFNNAQWNDSDNYIDALPQPVNALIRGMKLMGVQESDIGVFDASRTMPPRFCNKIIALYPGVKFFCQWDCMDGRQTAATFNSTAPSATLNFSKAGAQSRKIADQLVNAKYVINMPIMKDHDIAGVTLGFKNHYGSINWIINGSDNTLHDRVRADSDFDYNYSPLVDIFANANIGPKTVLTVGDGLYGIYGTSVNSKDVIRWQSFGNDAPNSLLFSIDPVAVDCVMIDILDAETGAWHPWREAADNYLKLAAARGMGVYERGNPSQNNYTKIDYVKVNL